MLAAAALAAAPACDAACEAAADAPLADVPLVAPLDALPAAPDDGGCAAGCGRGGGGGAAGGGSAVTRAPQLGQNFASASIGLPHCPQNMAAS
jgi:hypothetical protein